MRSGGGRSGGPVARAAGLGPRLPGAAGGPGDRAAEEVIDCRRGDRPAGSGAFVKLGRPLFPWAASCSTGSGRAGGRGGRAASTAGGSRGADDRDRGAAHGPLRERLLRSRGRSRQPDADALVGGQPRAARRGAAAARRAGRRAGAGGDGAGAVGAGAARARSAAAAAAGRCHDGARLGLQRAAAPLLRARLRRAHDGGRGHALRAALGYYLQAGALHAALARGLRAAVALQFAMLLAIEFPDAAGDAAPASARSSCGSAARQGRASTRR